MYWKDAREELKTRLKEYADTHLEKSPKAGKGMYNCPSCGSGTGGHGTGALGIYGENLDKWKCQACGEKGSLFDLIGIVEGDTDFFNNLRRAGELYGVEIDDYTENPTSNRTSDRKDKKEARDKVSEEKNYSKMFEYSHKRVEDTDYFTRRGLSKETIDYFNLGYNPEYMDSETERTARVIIPTSSYSFQARAVDSDEPGKKYRKGGHSHIFNIKALEQTDKPVIVVEGEFDAMSIYEVGGQAIGLGSTSGKEQLVKHLKDNPPKCPYIVLALDNDDAGKECSDYLLQELKKLNIQRYSVSIYDGYKDANELLIKDREKLREMVEKCDTIPEQIAEQKRQEYLRNSAGAHIMEFTKEIKESAIDTPCIKTGFPLLDKHLDGGLYEGLYFIGARSGLGKTTFVLSITDHIAKEEDKDILIFSLEMSRSELMAKSISRHTCEIAKREGINLRTAKTARGITAGHRYSTYSQDEKKLIAKAIEEYSQYAHRVFIYEGVGNIGVQEIKDKVEEHIAYTGRKPVVVVDYLQIMSPHDVRATDKQIVDYSVLNLKEMSRRHKIPVITISAFNRGSYGKKDVDEDAFRESSSIEYTSNCLISLKYREQGESDFNLQEAKLEKERDIELNILKNRFAPSGGTIYYEFMSALNYWNETGEKKR